MSQQQLGLLLLSCVRHQGTYAPLFAAQPGVEIVAVADDPDVPDWMHTVNQQFADEYSVPYIRDVQGALQRTDVQIVSICSEPTRHAGLVIQAARAGKHICVDKPMATTTADADAVLNATAETDVTLTYIHRLYSPAIQNARAQIDSGAVGLPYALHLTYVSAGGLTSGAVEDFELVVNPELSGGGELMNFLGYHIDTARYLTGLEVQQVYTSAGTYFFDPHRQYGVEDFGVVCLTLEKDVTATIIVGRSPTPSHETGGDYTLRIHGSAGTLLEDELRPRLSIFGPGSSPPSRTAHQATTAMVAPVITEFIESVRSNRQPLRTAYDGKALTGVIEAAYWSMQSGQVEPVHRDD